MRIAVIGGVASTRLLIEKLYQNGFLDVHIFGYVPANTTNVSGWVDLSEPAQTSGYSFDPFVRVGECIEVIKRQQPDLIFAVGLSQLIPDEILAVPRLGVIGFHPTALPKGRGRAPIAWLVLKQENGAATFFILRAGIDDGPILVQEHFEVNAEDTAATVEAKILLAEAVALDRWLPELATGSLVANEQEHDLATWYGRRTPEDGWVNWHASADAILQLIRASTHPHPGAYTFNQDHKISVWSAHLGTNKSESGVLGRILKVDGCNAFTVQCGDQQVLTVTDWESSTGWSPKVGMLLGYYAEAEIYDLRQTLCHFKEQLQFLQVAVQRLKLNKKPSQHD